MTSPPASGQQFKLYGPSGEVIMTGSMSAILERIPDSVARNAALDDAVRIASDAVEAEERLQNARACAARTLCDSILHLEHRIDAFEKARSLAAKRAEAERQRRDRQRVQSYIDGLPDPDDPNPDPYSIDPQETPADADPAANAAPQDPDMMGEVYDPQPAPDPGSILYDPPHRVVPQPTSTSLW